MFLPIDLFGTAPVGAVKIALPPEHVEQRQDKVAKVFRVDHLGDQTRLDLTREGYKFSVQTDVNASQTADDTLAIQLRHTLTFETSGAHAI